RRHKLPARFGNLSSVLIENFPPGPKLGGQGGINFPAPVVVCVVPQAVVTMSIIRPARMIEDRIKTEAVDRHAILDCGLGLLADVPEPAPAHAVFRSGFRNNDGTMITVVYLIVAETGAENRVRRD